MMALTRVNPVVSHCAMEASTPVSTMMDGRAGVTTVWFRMATKVPNTMTASIRNCLRVSFTYLFLRRMGQSFDEDDLGVTAWALPARRCGRRARFWQKSVRQMRFAR